GTVGALKLARTREGWVGRETLLLARLQRRWGPALLDAGRTAERVAAFGIELPAGASWMVTSWVEGKELELMADRADEERRTLAAIVAHGVGRGLEELHRSGVRHGDVKPANILLGARPSVDRAIDRGATLVDLDLAAAVTQSTLEGATPRYLSTELRNGEAPTPAADLYALGLVLAEILVPGLARANDLDSSRIAAALLDLPAPAREISAWIASLVARAPGARPSGAWIAARAARWLDLGIDREESVADRRAQVRRAYVAARSQRIARGGRVAKAIDGPARAWLDEALALARGNGTDDVPPMDALEAARWLVTLVGPAASAWPVPAEGEGPLASRLLDLAALAPPEAWTPADLVGTSGRHVSPFAQHGPVDEPSLWVELTRALAAPCPDVLALERAEEAVANGRAPGALAVDLAGALLRRGDVGRAFAAIASAGEGDDEANLLRAEIARRRGEAAIAEEIARRTSSSATAQTADAARALLGRLAWDAGDLARAEHELGDASGPAASEVRALVAYARGEHERGLAALEGATRATDGGLGLARIEGTRGMLEHARGRAAGSHDAFARAVDLAARAGAVVEEATYLTGLAAAAVDAGAVASALPAAMRGALLWERLGRSALAARAHLSRAAAYAVIGASHEAELSAGEARRLALASNDVRAAAFARWAIVETRAPGDPRGRDEALAAASELAASTDEDRVRSAARVLVWAGDVGPTLSVPATDERARTLSAAARWEWWGARAAATPASPRVLGEVVALLDVPAPVASRGPALAAGARLARDLGDGEATRRIEGARRALAATLREGVPASHRAALATLGWLDGIVEEDPRSALGAAQVGELETIVRALSSRDRLKPLLEQVVDTMVLWTGVERG
ncbi:MAG: Response regulator of zinc sigma-54-dependent two-component system, partial [Labilithrix sp.]|nr:Response regulator of zinc sigma-54-dependent two-component system [Labilithrix sp.]